MRCLPVLIILLLLTASAPGVDGNGKSILRGILRKGICCGVSFCYPC
nr:conotoxin precursor T [Conus judaeus]